MTNVSSFLDLTQLARARSGGQLAGAGSGNDSDGGSVSDSDTNRIPVGVPRVGVMGCFRSLEHVTKDFAKLIAERFPAKPTGLVSRASSAGPVNALHIVVVREKETDPETMSKRLTDFLRQHLDILRGALIRRVTFMVSHHKVRRR